jgi:hypothetical protein
MDKEEPSEEATGSKISHPRQQGSAWAVGFREAFSPNEQTNSLASGAPINQIFHLAPYFYQLMSSTRYFERVPQRQRAELKQKCLAGFGA